MFIFINIFYLYYYHHYYNWYFHQCCCYYYSYTYSIIIITNIVIAIECYISIYLYLNLLSILKLFFSIHHLLMLKPRWSFSMDIIWEWENLLLIIQSKWAGNTVHYWYDPVNNSVVLCTSCDLLLLSQEVVSVYYDKR